MGKKTFEENMQDLENVVVELEKGDITLEEAVEKFEQGMKISKECNDLLEESEKRISILLNVKDGFKEEDFKTED